MAEMLKAPGDDAAQAVDADMSTGRMAELEAEVAQVRADLETLREQFAEFRKQFES